MKTTFKKALSLAMVLMMVVSTMVILPLTASAEDVTAEQPPLVGDVYEISKPGQLLYLSTVNYIEGNYVLKNDIDMSGVTNFLGLKAKNISIDGQGYAIKNLTVKDGYATVMIRPRS